MLIPTARIQGVVPLLEADPWFVGLPPACRGWLAAAARRRALVDAECAYRVGDPPGGLYRVLSGGVRLVSYPEAGRQLVNLTVPAGRWFGELSTLDGGPRPHDAVAIGRTVLLHIPMRDIIAAAEAAPELYRHVALLACQHQRAAIDYIGVMLLRSPPARLAHMLLAMAADEPGGRQVRVSQEDLAGRIGLSRQSLSRLLGVVEREGLIRRAYGRIDILDPDGLAALGR